MPTYVLCQLIGATLASVTLKVLYNDKVDIRVTVTQYLSSTSDLEALVWESIITSILMLTICGVATDHRGVQFVKTCQGLVIFSLSISMLHIHNITY